jgi:hypothetical protein
MSQPVENPENNDTTGNTVPNPETGAGIGAGGEPTTFEPEEDPEAVSEPTE